MAYFSRPKLVSGRVCSIASRSYRIHSFTAGGYVEEFATVFYPSATALFAVQRRRHVDAVYHEASRIGVKIFPSLAT